MQDNCHNGPSKGLTETEYRQICEGLGHAPNELELGMFNALWSEHSSYKSSHHYLNKLKDIKSPHVLYGGGYNAGVVDIGDGKAVVFKVESHNHPLQINAYEGAATGVGGICRDVLAMGGNPMVLIDYLCFSDRQSEICQETVQGVGGYANAIGIPTVSGVITLDNNYTQIPLLNVFCLGIADQAYLYTHALQGVGNVIVCLGRKTGSDGMHGSTMASQSFETTQKPLHSAIQISDPFMGRCLIDLFAHLIPTKMFVAISDVGAAGITGALSEMAVKGNQGIMIDLEKIPKQHDSLSPYELMLSETQERMLVVIRKEKKSELFNVCKEWDVPVEVIGEVTDSKNIQVFLGEKLCADVPIALLKHNVASVKKTRASSYIKNKSKDFYLSSFDLCRDVETRLHSMLSFKKLCSRQDVYRNYDYDVGHHVVFRPDMSDATVVRVDDQMSKAVVIGVASSKHQASVNAYQNACLAVIESYSRVVASGGKPLAMTNGLNAGSPEKPEVMWQFEQMIDGMAETCQALSIPVVSGNVSLYNEVDGNAIDPTVMIGMVGVSEHWKNTLSNCFQQEGDCIAVIGRLDGDLSGSVYEECIHDTFQDKTYEISCDEVKDVCAVLDETYSLLHSVCGIYDGGLLFGLVASALQSNYALDIQLPQLDSSKLQEELLFGEAPARFLVSFSPNNEQQISSIAKKVGFNVLGTVINNNEIQLTMKNTSINMSINALREAWTAHIN